MRACIALLIVLVAVGCDSAPAGTGGSGQVQNTSKFVGTWYTTDSSSSTPNIALKLDPDGTLTCQIISKVMLFGGSYYMTGTWREDGGKLCQTLKDVKLINMNPNLTSPKFEQDMIDGARRHLPFGKETSNPVTWNGDNSFSTDDGGGKRSVYNRKI